MRNLNFIEWLSSEGYELLTYATCPYKFGHIPLEVKIRMGAAEHEFYFCSIAISERKEVKL